MYKARVEAVSGTKIFAGGKWLQCIGNKNFRVGELAWTDGRCVYGNHYTPQQPLVITAAPQDEGIPIYLLPTSPFKRDDPSAPYGWLEGNAVWLDYYTYTHKLKEVASNQPRTNAPLYLYKIINDHKGNVYYTNSTRWESSYYISPLGVIAANIDKNNNFYTIRMRRGSDTGSIYLYHADIIKNGTVVNSFDPTNCLAEAFNRVESLCTPLQGTVREYNLITPADGSYYQRYAHIYWGFIEDENNWALLMTAYINVEIYSDEKVGEMRTGYGSKASVERTHHHRVTDMPTFLITQDGITQLHHMTSGYKYWGAADWYDADTWERHIIHDAASGDPESEGVDAPDAKIPMQDGYYYTVNSVTVSRYTMTVEPPSELPSLQRFEYHLNVLSAGHPVNLSLFTPNGDKIMDGDFLLWSNITIRKIAATKYLIGVGIEQSFLWNEDVVFPYKDEDYIKPGLYLCEKGELTLINSASCMNHRLRHMKKIRGWQNRIRDLPTE